LAFSRQQRLEPRTVDLALLLAEEHTMLRRVIPESIKLGLQRPPSAVWVHADPGQLSQVILNLALNARDALPNGGELSLSLEVSDTLAVLRVKDNGLGMNADTLERVFEPFFSTKGPQAGTGLGLATVHGIVTQSGGSIYVTSEPGGGSEFRVTFPLAAEPPASADTPADAQSSALPPSTVLLVEDDPVIRATSARLLQEMGLEVIESASAADALSRYRKAPHAVDLVLTDIVMPGGSGPDLLRELCAERPVRALFMSGYLDDAQRDPLLTRVPFLAKPFNFDELRRKLRIALGSPPIDPAG
jgi:CheY-like chemotaxis protein